ncbi:fimbria/pilus outer membrane usher protein [Atlantibacter subterranea]|uniref:Fimbria/pilus outer membrane usher protein n=2 Tax=Atlantibacter subterraneus TaxID=255519 RepID=A0ABU4E1F6_9ENTR|nr:fimbria/pilus outer membrane usher protein [Atlantibacter subterranea]MDV7022926.1 fimbria/pilus outer membrane usher protein [Atlantibacter subterranea]MDZ5667748.1 fimbria/pilus outer membrane usher protein [Atlantibacter hermannii]
MGLAIGIASWFSEAFGRDYFNPELLEIDNPALKGADLTAFESGGQLAGTYYVDIILNGQKVDSRDVRFKTDDAQRLVPCLSAGLLESYGVKTTLFPDMAHADECATLNVIPQATSEFVFSHQKLDLSIPQAALAQHARGYVAPELWDEGITAALLNYSMNGANNRSHGSSDSDSQYVNLRPGINIGPWRLRNYTTWRRDNQSGNQWDNVYSYAQRSIAPLKSQLILGDSSAPSDVFDSMPFRGGQLASDDEMLPDSLKGYAPVVRGIARTNAQVVIRQNGYVIYQSYVAAGAFEITDMYSTGGAGDLNVTIKEADGSEQNYTVPFASLPVLQREGRLKYALTGGQYRSYDGSVENTPFGQASAIYGLPWGFTLYGGTQQSAKYQSYAVGVGKNLGEIGAVSGDVTQAASQPKGQAQTQGQSWRIRYSKNIVQTGTHFAIAGYRYSTNGYYGMQEVLDSWGDSAALNNRRRNRMELTVSQTLGGRLGSLMASAVQEDYWNSPGSMRSLSASYNNAWQGISYGLTWTLSKNNPGASSSATDRQIAINVSVPLDRWMANSWANYNLNSSRNNGTTHGLGLNGMALAGNTLNWSVQQGYGSDGVGYTGSANGDYKGTYGQVTAGYGYDRNSQRLSYGLAGGIIAHADGVTFSQPLGETNVLIKAPGAAGAGVNNQRSVKTDFRGYGITSNVTPFHKNDIGLNTASLPDDVELALTSQTVIPTRGAVVRADYITSVGKRILLTLVRSGRQTVPFGAMATLQGRNGPSAIVGDDGQVYLTGMPQAGTLEVVWGSDDQQRCTADFTLPTAPGTAPVILLQSVCR